MDVENKNEWEDCLDVGGVKLPPGLYFGTTAIKLIFQSLPRTDQELISRSKRNRNQMRMNTVDRYD